MKNGGEMVYSLKDMFLGLIPGAMGEISALALLIGGLYLILRKVISWRIPVSYIGTVALLTLIFGGAGMSRVDFMLYNVLGGGLMLGAFFMATDYATSPVTLKGQLLYGAGCGAITVLIRYFGSNAEGVSYAILTLLCCQRILLAFAELKNPNRIALDLNDAVLRRMFPFFLHAAVLLCLMLSTFMPQAYSRIFRVP